MAKKTEMFAAMAAMLSSVLTLGCCLPLGFVAAMGAAGGAAFLSSARPWLLLLSVLLLGFGFYQLYRGARCGMKPSRVSMTLLGLAVVVVVLLVLFPQFVAGFLADHLGRNTP